MHSGQEDKSCLVVDSLQLRRAGLADLLAGWGKAIGVSVRALAASDLSGAMPRSERVALTVLNLGGESIADLGPSTAIATLKEQLPDTPLVIISDLAQADESVRAFRIGARGHIPTTTPPEIALQALSFILAGGSFFPPTALLEPAKDGNGRRGARSLKGMLSQHATGLTQRQSEILELLHKGMPNKLIARRLDLRESTVKVHMRQILRKLGVQNRTEAAIMGPPQITAVPQASARMARLRPQ